VILAAKRKKAVLESNFINLKWATLLSDFGGQTQEGSAGIYDYTSTGPKNAYGRYKMYFDCQFKFGECLMKEISLVGLSLFYH
jgi:hypothetical protein